MQMKAAHEKAQESIYYQRFVFISALKGGISTFSSSKLDYMQASYISCYSIQNLKEVD